MCTNTIRTKANKAFVYDIIGITFAAEVGDELMRMQITVDLTKIDHFQGWYRIEINIRSLLAYNKAFNIYKHW